MMTDLNPHQASLRRCSVSESDIDPMITTSLRKDPKRFIPKGRSESQLVWDPVLVAVDKLNLED